MPRVALLCLLALLGSGFAVAQDLYVTDQLEITLRSGPGLSYKILEMVPSGTPLEKVGEEEGWAQVRTPGGAEGWVVARYLTPEPPKGPRLHAAERELAELRAETAELRETLETARTQGSRAATEGGRLRERLEEVEAEFARWKEAHADTVAIRQRALSLAEELETARAELERLQTENRSLRAREKFYWFFSGVVVLLVGWALGYGYASSRHRSKGQSKFRF